MTAEKVVHISPVEWAAEMTAAKQRGIAEALDAVVARADDGNEFGPKNYLLLLRIVTDVRTALAHPSTDPDG